MSDSTDNIVTYSSSGRVATITLNRPEARNAINNDVVVGFQTIDGRFHAGRDVIVDRVAGLGTVEGDGGHPAARRVGDDVVGG
ncbi:MAG: hypothetical protein ACKOD2_12625, partial [Ilumatobacteraceae bacterium]